MSTGYPQLFAQACAGVFRGFSSLFSQILHTDFNSFSVQHSNSFFLSLYDAFPHDLTSSTGRKKGEKEANTRFCGKRVRLRCFASVKWFQTARAHVLWHVEQFQKLPLDPAPP
jgi:hypothetical protein